MTTLLLIRRAGIITLICLLMYSISYADYVRKWGEIDPQTRDLTVYQSDSLADAVIIFDIGEMEIGVNGQFRYELKRHYQIKILKTSGLSHADVIIAAREGDKITDIKAITISPGGKKHKLKRKNIHSEKHSDVFKIKKFTLPNVEVGSVIEVQYSILSKYVWLIAPWRFQSEIPTLESTVILKMSPGFSYSAKVTNDTLSRIEHLTDMYMNSDYRISLKMFIFSGKNLPAIREVPYVSSLDDYKAKLVIQLSAYKRPNVPDIVFIQDLQSLCTELLRSDYGTFQKPQREIRERTKQLLESELTEADSMQAIYAFVRDSLEDEDYVTDYFPGKKQKQVLSSMKAASAERNLLLIAMLKSAGFDARSVLISTLDNGRIDPELPILDQYNHVIVLLNTETAMRLVDATDRFTPFGKLPPHSLVKNGLIVDSIRPQTMFLPNSSIKSTNRIATQFYLDEEFVLHGESRATSTGYACWSNSWDLETTESTEEFLSEILGSFQGRMSYSEYDSGLVPIASDTFLTTFAFDLEKAAEEIDHEIYLRPVLFHRLKENPFISATREFPVDFGYRWTQTEASQLELNDRYQVVYLPKDLWISSAYISYKRTATQISPTQVGFVRTLEIKEISVGPKHYNALKADFARIVDADAEQIILKRVLGPSDTVQR